MLRILLTLVLVAWVSAQVYDDRVVPYYGCSIWGDPHVIRFGKDNSPETEEVLCKQSGWQTLVKNQYWEGLIHVTESAWFIDEFTFEFFGNDPRGRCTVTQENFYKNVPTCSNGVKVIKDPDMLIIQDKAHDITVFIRKHGPEADFYSVWVLQSAEVIAESTGICKSSCGGVTRKVSGTRQRRATTPARSVTKQNAEKTCEFYISKLVPNFKITALKQMEYPVKNAYTGCVADLKVTGDLEFAKSAVEMLVISLATKDLTSDSDFDKIRKEIGSLIVKTNSLINNGKLPVGKPSVSTDDFRYTFDERESATLNCRNTWTFVIRITSASYQTRSGSCATNVTERLRALCEKKRSCSLKVLDDVLQTSECEGDDKQLKINYECK